MAEERSDDVARAIRRACCTRSDADRTMLDVADGSARPDGARRPLDGSKRDTLRSFTTRLDERSTGRLDEATDGEAVAR